MVNLKGAGLLEGDVPEGGLMVRGVVLNRDVRSVVRQLDIASVNCSLGRIIRRISRQHEGELVTSLPVTAGQLLGHLRVRGAIKLDLTHLCSG